jgi:Ca2+/Na+ antiporter
LSRVVAWCVLLVVCFVVALAAYVVVSSSLSFFESEASKLAPKLDSAPQLRSIMESTLRFCSSFVWTVFALLLLALAISLLVLWIESLASR